MVDYTGDEFYELHAARIKTRNTHGTGCSLASCIAAELAKGSPMLSAVKVSRINTHLLCFMSFEISASIQMFVT